jgi:hypothetical protein
MRSRNTFLPKKDRKRLNAPPLNEPWIWFPRTMLESEAYRGLSINALRVLFRIMIEHMAHAGLENGRLKVTTRDFEAYGVRGNSVRTAVDEVCGSGLVKMMVRGQKSSGINPGHAPQFCLTWLPVATEADHAHATNDWKSAGPKFFPLPSKAIAPPLSEAIAGTRGKPLLSEVVAGHRGEAPAIGSGSTYNIMAVPRCNKGRTA